MAEKPPPLPSEPRVRFDYLKSNFYRVIHVDGAIGGPSPNGHLVMSFFNERAPIPQQTEHRVQVLGGEKDGAVLGAEIPESRVSRDAVVREVEVSLVLDYKTAVIIHKWLGAHLENLKSLESQKRSEPLT